MTRLLLCYCLLALAVISWSAQAETSLRASAVKIDITPDHPQWLLGYQARKSEDVHDKLYHRILALRHRSSSCFERHRHRRLDGLSRRGLPARRKADGPQGQG